MLLKKWVGRDGKNATTDALTNILTKMNRMDIVTLLEGPIFDYGNISGTRSFAEDNNVFYDPTVDGYPSIQVELETPTGLRYVPPSPLHQDDFFSDNSSIESPHRTPSRLSGVLVTSQGNGDVSSAVPPVVAAEDTFLDDSRPDYIIQSADVSQEMTIHRINYEDVPLYDEPRHDGSYIWVEKSVQYSEQKSNKDASQRGDGNEQHERETSGPEEMTEERLKLLFKDLQLEQEVESEEMTEEKVKTILKHVEQAEQEMSSIAGWHSEASSIHVEPQTPDLKQKSERVDDSHESITSYLKGEVGRLESNVSPSETVTEAKTRSTESDPVKPSDKQTMKPKTHQGSAGKGEQISPITVHQKSQAVTSKTVIGEHKSSVPVSAKRIAWEDGKTKTAIHAEEGATSEQKSSGKTCLKCIYQDSSDSEYDSETSSDEERRITTKVTRRRLILKVPSADGYRCRHWHGLFL
ncbi:hypothetical protein FKM82_027618 [Ascaphus truei]